MSPSADSPPLLRDTFLPLIRATEVSMRDDGCGYASIERKHVPPPKQASAFTRLRECVLLCRTTVLPLWTVFAITLFMCSMSVLLGRYSISRNANFAQAGYGYWYTRLSTESEGVWHTRSVRMDDDLAARFGVGVQGVSSAVHAGNITQTARYEVDGGREVRAVCIQGKVKRVECRVADGCLSARVKGMGCLFATRACRGSAHGMVVTVCETS